MKSLKIHLSESLNESKKVWNKLKMGSVVNSANEEYDMNLEDPLEVNEWLYEYAYELGIHISTPPNREWLKSFHKNAKIRMPFTKWILGISWVED